MTDERMEKLKEQYLSQKDKPEKVRMYEFLNHVKHEIRTNMRERRNDYETSKCHPL